MSATASQTHVNGGGLNEVPTSDHARDATLVGQPSIFAPAPMPPSRNWVPDVNDPKNLQRPRTIVLCFDGTGDQFDDDNSNVVNFVTLLKKDDKTQQLVYYQTGIGTYTKSSFVTPIVTQMSRTLDEMFAWNLSSHVMDGYEFLMQNYTAGDKISIFGFSRGAYTARALAGMIQKVGLLPAFNVQQIPFAWAMYNREDKDGLKLSVSFKKSFCVDIKLDFVGVWDTVASVGITNKELPFVGNNHAIRVFRHAIALDEHRAKFMPNFYHATPLKPVVTASDEAAAAAVAAAPKTPQRPKAPKHLSETQIWEQAINAQSEINTDALEVWFAGAHCDVGGGSVDNDTPHALARIPLRWMIRECFKTRTGIIFDADGLKKIGMDPATVYPEVQNRGDRRRPDKNAKIGKPESQPWAIIGVAKFFGTLLWIPIKFVFNVITWPIRHAWTLVKFSTPVRWTTDKIGLKPPTSKSADVAPVITDDMLVHTGDHINEEEEELHDALCPVYDQLKIAWWWWVIELIPFKHRWQKGARDSFYVRSNFGKGRKIYGDAREGGLKIHRSVKTRLEVVDAKGKSVYRPLAWFRTYNQDESCKIEGPETWNIDNPDPRTHWEWVE